MNTNHALAVSVEDRRSANRASGVPLPEALDAPRRELISPQAGKLSYYQDVSHDGRPLVLLHSVNAAPSAFEMKPLFEHFRATRRVYALDLPGFGFSDRSSRRYSPELFAQAITDFLREVVKDRADLVTFSLSGEFAARAILANPGIASSLVLLSPTGFSDRSLPTGGLSNGLLFALSLPLLSQGLYDLLTTRPSIRYFLRQSFVDGAPAEMVEYAYATSHQQGAKRAPLYFLAGKLFTPNAHNHLYARLQLPVLVLYDQDPNVSFEHLPAVVATNPNWQAERIAPSRGVPHWEKTAETVAAIERFWAATAAPEQPRAESQV